MNKAVVEKYIEAGRIAGEARELARKMAKPGIKLFDIAEKTEAFIKERGAEIAFPVNLSLNDIGAHYTPTRIDDSVISKNDMLKIDIGVHIDGYIGDTACTVVFKKEHEKLKEASEKAVAEAIKLCVPGALLSDISVKIEETIKGFGFKPIANLTGHGLKQYQLHAEPQIPNIKIFSNYRLKEEQVIAIEPFATDGGGFVKESGNASIFSMNESLPVRNQDARRIIRFVEKRRGLPFAERWLHKSIDERLPDNVVKTKIALREMKMRRIVNEYPVLKEIKGGLISQCEHTIIVRDKPIITTRLKSDENETKEKTDNIKLQREQNLS